VNSDFPSAASLGQRFDAAVFATASQAWMPRSSGAGCPSAPAGDPRTWRFAPRRRAERRRDTPPSYDGRSRRSPVPTCPSDSDLRDLIKELCGRLGHEGSIRRRGEPAPLWAPGAPWAPSCLKDGVQPRPGAILASVPCPQPRPVTFRTSLISLYLQADRARACSAVVEHCFPRPQDIQPAGQRFEIDVATVHAVFSGNVELPHLAQHLRVVAGDP
jgi:hypothetical protein